MADLASTSDIAEAWRLLTGDEINNARAQLKFASAIVRAKLPSVDARITAGTLSADIVTGVVVAMVLRVMRNPEGKAEEQIEDYRYKLDSTRSAGSMFLTDDELALLRGRRSGGAFSITPTFPNPDYATDVAVAAARAARDLDVRDPRYCP